MWSVLGLYQVMTWHNMTRIQDWLWCHHFHFMFAGVGLFISSTLWHSPESNNLFIWYDKIHPLGPDGTATALLLEGQHLIPDGPSGWHSSFTPFSYFSSLSYSPSKCYIVGVAKPHLANCMWLFDLIFLTICSSWKSLGNSNILEIITRIQSKKRVVI